MQNLKIKEKCKVNTSQEDTFVGIMCKNGDINIHFPLGFEISDNDKELRKEILLLIHSISSTVGRKDSEICLKAKNYNFTGFPIQSYMYLIYDFFARGYYRERDIEYTESNKGKINWNRTIKTQKPYIQDLSAYYLKFITKKKTVNKDQLITLIHEYCIYDSFQKIGWLFSDIKVKEPRIKFNEKLFKSIIKSKFQNTHNDKNKKLFINMLAIIDNLCDINTVIDYKYGTYRFEYVWEAIVDRVYGIREKSKYFPKTSWKIKNKKYNNASLEPDTIMICNNNVYVLDSKYYKYGDTMNHCDLPESTSINKQITYGEYVANERKFRELHGDNYQVFNAFIMPYNSAKYGNQKLNYIGEAESNWKTNEKQYEKIQGILVDTKHLMQISAKHDETEIEELANFIGQHF